MICGHLIYDKDNTAVNGKNLVLLMQTEVLCIVSSTDIEDSNHS